MISFIAEVEPAWILILVVMDIRTCDGNTNFEVENEKNEPIDVDSEEAKKYGVAITSTSGENVSK